MATAEEIVAPGMTAEEFLNWDGDGQTGKLELVYGEVRAMSPASGTHALIQATLASLIRDHLKSSKSPCRVGTETPIQPRFDAQHNVRVPNLAVTCLPPKDKEKMFPDPVLIVEILSPGNSNETWEAILACATIPTVSEILVVDSEKVWARVITKDQDGAWPTDKVIVEAGGRIKLSSINAEFAINDIYADTAMVGESQS